MVGVRVFSAFSGRRHRRDHCGPPRGYDQTFPAGQRVRQSTGEGVPTAGGVNGVDRHSRIRGEDWEILRAALNDHRPMCAQRHHNVAHAQGVESAN